MSEEQETASDVVRVARFHLTCWQGRCRRRSETTCAALIAKQAPNGHTWIFDLSPAEAIERTIQTLAPGARGAELAALFDDRTNTKRISDWRRGYRYPPAWAIEILRAKLQRKHAAELETASKIKTGPGLKAGARNLAEYLARRR